MLTASTLSKDVLPAFCSPIMVISISVALRKRVNTRGYRIAIAAKPGKLNEIHFRAACPRPKATMLKARKRRKFVAFLPEQAQQPIIEPLENTRAHGRPRKRTLLAYSSSSESRTGEGMVRLETKTALFADSMGFSRLRLRAARRSVSLELIVDIARIDVCNSAVPLAMSSVVDETGTSRAWLLPEHSCRFVERDLGARSKGAGTSAGMKGGDGEPKRVKGTINVARRTLNQYRSTHHQHYECNTFKSQNICFVSGLRFKGRIYM